MSNDMMTRKTRKKTEIKPESAVVTTEYKRFFDGIAEVLENARRTSARTVNAIMTATYWEIGRRIVEFEQKGAARGVWRGFAEKTFR